MQGMHISDTSKTRGGQRTPRTTARNIWGGNVRIAAGLVAGMIAAPAALGGASAPSHTTAAPQTTAARSVIVTLDGPLTPQRQAAFARLGAAVTRDLSFIHAAALRVPARNLGKLSALPYVRNVTLDAAVQKDDEFTVDSSLDNAAFQQYGLTGAGVTIAVVDSGIHQQAQDLQSPGGLSLLGINLLPKGSRVIDGINFVPNPTPVPPPAPPGGLLGGLLGGPTPPTPPTVVNANNYDDSCGHGTHVAGIIGGDGAASTGGQNFQTFYGIAPLANLVAVRVLDQNGQGSLSNVLSGIQWVIANKAKDKIRVMNLSLGMPVTQSYTTDPLCQAVEAAWQAGIVVVCAAGNDGRLNSANTPGASNEGWGTQYGSIQSPANDPYVITVGAMKSMDGNRADDRIATYSSRGPSLYDNNLKPDIVAPGNQVISLEATPNCTLATEYSGTNQIPLSTYQNVHGPNQSQTSNFYFRLSGTSMASPVVAAAAALLLQQSPSLSPDTIKARLMTSADKWTDPTGNGDACTYGAGYLDIPAALQSPVTVPAGVYALSPELVTDSQGNIDIAMNPSVYGSRAIWGCSGIWNANVTDLRAIWGCNAVAGSGALDASRAIWGCSTLVDTNTLNASRAIWGCSGIAASRAIWGCTIPGVDLSSIAINGE